MDENVLTVRLEKPLIKVMEKDMKEFHYSTKSDFLREAIREKHLKLEEERRSKIFLGKLLKLKGSLKDKYPYRTDEEYRKIREEVGEEYVKELAKRFNYQIPNQKQLLQAKAP